MAICRLVMPLFRRMGPDKDRNLLAVVTNGDQEISITFFRCPHAIDDEGGFYQAGIETDDCVPRCDQCSRFLGSTSYFAKRARHAAHGPRSHRGLGKGWNRGGRWLIRNWRVASWQLLVASR